MQAIDGVLSFIFFSQSPHILTPLLSIMKHYSTVEIAQNVAEAGIN